MSKMEYLDKLFSSNLILRIVAVCIACILWFYVTGDRASETVRSVRCPVSYVNIPAHTMLVDYNGEVVVQISGERDVFADLPLDKIVCEADLSGLDVGKYRLAVRVTVPREVKLLDIEPEQVDFELVKYIERSLPVTVKVKDGLPSGLFLESVNLSPREISIRGRESMVSMVKSLRVDPTLEQLETGGEMILPVKVISEGDKPLEIDLGTDKVTMSAILAKGIPKKMVPVEVKLIGSPQEDFLVDTVIVEPAKVEIEGPTDKLKAISEVVTPLYDISGIYSDQQVLLPLEPLNESIRIISDPSIMVKVKLKPFTVTRQFSGIRVKVEGKSIYPSWIVEPESIAVTVEGRPSDIDLLEQEIDLIEAYVNVTNFVSRKLTVPVQVRSRNRQIKVVSILPSKVSIKADIN